MHRIDHATAAPGEQFTEGNPGTGTPATTVTAAWLNDVQENICAVIAAAGIALDKGVVTQLRDAIQALLVAGQKAVIVSGVAFEASVTDGKVVRWDAGNNRFDEALADGTGNNRAVGVADVTNGRIYLYGECPLFSGLTPGGRYFLDGAVAGAVNATAPSDAVLIGIAKTATTLFVDIDAMGIRGDQVNQFTAGQRGAVVALADGATITPNFAAGNNFSVTLAGNRTLAAPTNLGAGQSGVVSITQDATGSRTLAFASAWKFAGGVVPSLTTTAGAKDQLAYYVMPDGASVWASLAKDVK